ncbi:ABC transporter ATP-binding protein [Paenibacillus hemerocallicola]|uniref:ABC transporter ATP-binding protein n=1 Tax=Paenibacillus hemerocallicola TaxID=1172614 RepID=A0A5C4TD91_9BACL|nr:ABC transporter ATP-binding protein [Paenibacillus hemerocallicola]TNJ66971.1 ABC transporter ATP-binding protein [Paenibacillus hemerocallicola]
MSESEAAVEPLLKLEQITAAYPVKGKRLLGKKTLLRAVDRVSLNVYTGETLGLVGESGCGKSTLGRTIVRLERPHTGRLIFEGRDITTLGQREMRPFRTRLQMIFQDPYTSLNPRRTVLDTLAEPYVVHRLAPRTDIPGKVAKLLDMVGLPRASMQRLPHEFSGGQRQRLGIARAIAFEPKLIVCDEPVSALDVSIQAQVLNLMADLQRELKLTYLFISHGIGAVNYISTRVAVMYLGRLVEVGDRKELFLRPKHPYTRILLRAHPPADPLLRERPRTPIAGEVPNLLNPPSGCRFHTRCPFAQERCRAEEPQLPEGQPHAAACHYPLA